jgi:flagellar biosynthesis/type III secretory pathway chaperone
VTDVSRDAAAVLQDLLQALREERAALLGNEVAQLADLAARKSTLLLQLAPHLSAPDGAHRTATLREAARINQLNGELLATRLAGTRAGLEALNIGAPATLYESRGTLTHSPATVLTRTSA